MADSIQNNKFGGRSTLWASASELLSIVAALLAALLLSSCQLSSPQVYRGRDTLPDQRRSAQAPPDQEAWRYRQPRAYEIGNLPPPDLKPRPEVEAEIYFYTRKAPRHWGECQARRQEFGPVLEQIFTDEGVPLELLNMALVESAYQTDVKSPYGAAGMWQFMKGTAELYGLKVKLFEDQRKDPILSTIAAARMLRDLYLTYDDWALALAAYNAGPVAVDRAVIQAGVADFWVISRKGLLNAETRKFVPRVYAAMTIEKDPAKYGAAR